MHDDAHDTAPPWQVSEESIAWLAEAKATRPAPPGCGKIMLTAYMAFLLVVSITTDLTGWSALCGGAGLGWFVWLARRGSGWRRTFQPIREGSSWLRILAPEAPRSPKLIYEFMRGVDDHQYLIVDFRIAGAFSIAPDMPPILRPDFDVALGVEGPTIVRALLGSDLAARLVSWSNRMNLTVHEGTIRVPILVDVPDFKVARTVCAPFGAFADRLADPTPALARIACTDTLFHAALAWCVLRERVADASQLLSPDTDPERAELLRLIDAGTSPFELPVGWPEKALIFRGMLSSLEPEQRHDSALCEQLLSQTPTDGASAIALFDMFDAANTHARLRGADPFMTRLTHWLAENGDAEVLAWLTQHPGRSVLRKARTALAGRIKARLHAEQAGRLALSGDSIQGALSDARAGDVSLADE